MTITRVGNLVAGAAKNGGNVTLTFSTTPAAGDVVYVIGGHHTTTDSNYGPQVADGYTQIKAPAGTGFKIGWWRKVLTAADTQTVCLGNGNGADVTVYACAVYRSVDNATPEDVAVPAFVGPTTSANPDCPATGTLVSSGCAVVIGAVSTTADATPGTPANYATPVGATNSDTTGALQIYISDRILVGGAGASEDPPAFGSWTSGTWIAGTVAARPFVPPPVFTGMSFYNAPVFMQQVIAVPYQ